MKKTLLTLLFIILCGINSNISAQDIIVQQNGDEIQVKVLKINSTEIEYKKWSNQDGPTYTIDKSDVFMIKYPNGEKDVFDHVEKQQKAQQLSNTLVPQYIKKLPAENNQQLIDRYKTPVQFTRTPSNKEAHYFFPIMSMSDSSIVSTSDIEMKIIPTIVYKQTSLSGYIRAYTIELQNKTDKIIYIDLTTTFRINSDGTSQSYYNTEQTTVNHGSSSGGGFNLGGITNVLGVGGAIGTLAGSTTVGGSSQHSVSTTYENQRILVIPPHSKKDLAEFKQVKIKKNEYKTISDLEYYGFILNSLRGLLKKDEYISYTENNSPYTVKYMIPYSTSQDFSEYSSLYAKLYVRYIYGGYIPSYNSEKGAIKYVKKYVSNFWDNPGIIVGWCSY